MRHIGLVPLVLVAAACNTENDLGDAYVEPLLRLENPEEAGWMDAGTVQVEGTARGLDDLKVSGVAATVDGETFTTEVELTRGLNVVEATGTDGHGTPVFVRHGVLAGKFADPVGAIDEALVARVNEGGLEVVMDSVSSQFTAPVLQGALASANPVYETSYGISSWEAVSVRADITSVWFEPMQIEAHPTQGILALEAVIPDFYVGLRVSGDIVGWQFAVDAALWASYIDIVTDATLWAENGDLQAALANTQIQFTGFGYDTSLIPGDIESYLLVDFIGGYIATTLSEQVNTQVPALLAGALAEFDVSFDTEILERDVHLEGSFARASIDEQGVELAMDLDVSIPGRGDHPYAGYLFAEAATPRPDRVSDVGLSMSDNLLNRVLFEAWAGELLSLEMSTEDGSLDPAMLAMLKAEEGTITVDARLPPVVVEKDRGLQAQLGELEVRIDTPGGELGNFIVLSVTLLADVDVEVQNGVMSLDVGTPELALVVRDSDWGASNEATTGLLEELVPVEAFTSLLGDIEIPLPEMAGVSIDRATISRDTTGVYTGVKVELD